MPELPEVETTCRGLAPFLEGRRIVDCKLARGDLRFPFPPDLAAKIKGAKVVKVARRAKYILIELANGLTLLLHLGMSGRLHKLAPDAPLGKHDHVVLTTDKGIQIRFTDPRRFGILDLVVTKQVGAHKLLRHLGPEPLDALTPAHLAGAFKGKKTSIKAALLDQGVVAGLGNIYVSEALFHAGISPKRQAGRLNANEIKKLVPAIRKVLKSAIRAGGSSLRDYAHADGSLGSFQNNFAVYDRAGRPCPGCTCDIGKSGGIRRIVQAGRATYYCLQKQK